MKRVKITIKRWNVGKAGKVVLRKCKAKGRIFVSNLETLLKGGDDDNGAYGC